MAYFNGIIKTGVLFIILAGLLSCSGEDNFPGTAGRGRKSGDANPDTIQVIDGNGELREIKKPVNRIIVEYIDNAELVRILGREDRIVGIAGYDYIFKECTMQFPEIRKKPTVGLFWKFDYEAVLGLTPDLVLTFGADTSEKRDKLPGVNVLFLGLYYPDLSNPHASAFIRGVRSLGKILDADERSENFIGWYLNIVDMIKTRIAQIPENEKPSVLITSYPHTDLDTISFSAYMKKDTLSQALNLAGGRQISESLPEYSQGGVGVKVDLEWIMKEDPEIIIMHAVDIVDICGYETDDPSSIAKALGHILSRPELAGLKAVKNKHVYVFDGHFRNDASGGIVAAAYMAKIFHPELFTDINPEAIHQQYLDMQGLKYDLNLHGMFLYPPITDGNNLMGIPDRHIQRSGDDKD